jgi:hypothetical protein
VQLLHHLTDLGEEHGSSKEPLLFCDLI